MEKELANVILGRVEDGDKFEIKYWGIKFKLSIKPLSPKKLIAISGFLCRIREIEEGQSSFHALMKTADDLKLICNSIAISTGFPFRRFLCGAIMKLSLEDVETLFNILIKQSNAAFFLNTMVLGKNLNILKLSSETNQEA